MAHPVLHFRTITHHRHLVLAHCFKLGLYWQGLTHDLSKYSPTEFIPGAKYFTTGTGSPNNEERRATGVSKAWVHHKGRNKHHLEYWIDWSPDPAKKGQMFGAKMPVRYVVEMYCDRVAACKNYQKDNYSEGSALKYFEQGSAVKWLHPDTAALLRHLLEMLAGEGEKKTNRYIRQVVLKGKYDY